ncbi:hypothetical protein IWX90DRAFT_517533 [Phyllosticta citrichinensis]|uniref:Uncharacterized protein n=1 Tax=Phyllosticta citrichinensis TaxID=1130410 RepID=A0ABR1XFH7_9PEZI
MANKRYNLRRRPGQRANSGDAAPPADDGEQLDSNGQPAEASSALQPEEPPQAASKKGKARRKPNAEESCAQQAEAPSQQEPPQEPQKKKKKWPKVSKWASQKAMNKITYKSAPQKATKPTRKPGKERTQRWSVKDLKPYEDYPALYKERKESKTFIRQRLSFTDDLPAELRLMVYSTLPGIDGKELIEEPLPRDAFAVVEELVFSSDRSPKSFPITRGSVSLKGLEIDSDAGTDPNHSDSDDSDSDESDSDSDDGESSLESGELDSDTSF